jgi:hypothetical protein
MPLFNAYHDANDATHQGNVTQLSSQGYHPIALSVYGDPSSPLYAAVWVQEPAPVWTAIHGKNAAQYQAWITNTVQAQGYSLRLVTVVGSGSSVVFAAVAEKTGALWAAKHDLTNGGMSDANSLQTFLDTQRKAGLVPTAIAIYGSPGSPLFAVACQGVSQAVQWAYFGTPVDATQWQNCFNAFTRVPLRPGHFSISSDQQYIGVFRNDSLGLQAVRHGMTGSDYQTFVNQMKAQGNFPVIVAGAGSGSNTRYAAAFAKQTTPIARQWTATGNAVPYLSALDTTLQNFMEGYAVRAGSVAVVRKGRWSTRAASRGVSRATPSRSRTACSASRAAARRSHAPPSTAS